MPHRTSANSNSLDPGRMTSSTTSVLFPNRTGVALSDPQPSSSSSQSARNHSSLPIPEHFPEVDSRSNKIDEFMFDNQKQLGNRHTMIANYNNTSKQRTQYYEEQFQYKDNATSSAKEKVQRDSPVVAELRTNVIIKDEFTLVTDLSYHLAARYTRPDSAVMVKVDHSSCLALGGTFDPCYILEITAVPSQMGPTMNKRNAALIQSFMADILSVPPERGIVKFSPIPEENFAINGTTMLGEAERKEKQQANESGSAVRRAISSGRKSIPSFKKSSAKLNGDAKMAELKPIESNTSDAHSAAGSQERKGSTTSANTQPPEGVFELPAVNLDKPRPSTSHSHSGSGGSNPLRMNGISDLELSLRNSKNSNERPRTVSGGVGSIQDRIRNQANMEAASAPAVKRQSVGTTAKDRAQSFLKVDPSKILPKSGRPTSAGKGGSRSVSDGNPRPRDSPMDGAVSPLSPTSGKEPTIFEKPSQEAVFGKEEPTANTAKRRSTINASTSAALPPKGLEPPPVPLEETKSMRSFRLGKRKSFLAAFRRSTAAAS